jgi:cysteine desulfurase/selenocysteine lyase
MTTNNFSPDPREFGLPGPEDLALRPATAAAPPGLLAPEPVFRSSPGLEAVPTPWAPAPPVLAEAVTPTIQELEDGGLSPAWASAACQPPASVGQLPESAAYPASWPAAQFATGLTSPEAQSGPAWPVTAPSVAPGAESAVSRIPAAWPASAPTLGFFPSLAPWVFPGLFPTPAPAVSPVLEPQADELSAAPAPFEPNASAGAVFPLKPETPLDQPAPSPSWSPAAWAWPAEAAWFRQSSPSAVLASPDPFASPRQVEVRSAQAASERRPAGAQPPPALVGLRPVADIRRDFPILRNPLPDGRPLIWLDNAATSQKPRQVVERLARYYEQENSNVHRGAHALADKATEVYEEARAAAARFIGAPGPENIVFVRGATEGLNLVAQAFVKPRLKPGDEIILTALEHHANIVPWQQVAQETGAVLKVAPIDARGQLIYGRYAELFSSRTRFVSLTHVSNALGTVVEASELVALARSWGVPTAVDGAQSIPHLPVDVKSLGADFFVFSGHKIFGPTGIGVVYGTTQALEEARPYQGGGSMIVDVTFERTIYKGPPDKFEAGTPNIAGAVGLHAALDYFSSVGVAEAAAYEEALLSYASARLSAVPGLRIVGTAPRKVSVLSFVLAGRSIEEVGAHLARAGVAVRAGHHCAQPAVRSFGLEGTVRPSLAFYNTPEEVDQLVEAVSQLAR